MPNAMPATHMPFDLRFSAIPANDHPPLEGQLRLSVTPPDAGWMRWKFEWSDPDTTIYLSYIFRLCNIWFWSVAVAHRLLPVTLIINQEGVFAELCAEWDDIAQDRLRLTLRNIDDAETPREFERHVWFDRRENWLRNLGQVFGKHFGTDFNAPAWHCGSPHWPEAACFLPWDWPARIAPRPMPEWPPEKSHACFFAMLARNFEPCGDRLDGANEDVEKSVRLRFLFANLRKEAAIAALRALGVAIPAETEEDKAARQTLIDLFEETDYPEEMFEDASDAEDAAPSQPTMNRGNRLLLACADAEDADRPLCEMLNVSIPFSPQAMGKNDAGD